MSNSPLRSLASGIGRARDRLLVDALVRAAARHGGELTEDAMFEAVSEVHQGGVTRKSAARIVAKKLANPNIRAALSSIYEALADFSVADAVRKHVEHINGVEFQAVTESGDVVDVQDKPSWPALKGYLDMTLPQSPSKRATLRLPSSVELPEESYEIEARAF